MKSLPEDEIGIKIAKLMGSAPALPTGIAERLANARHLALAHRRQGQPSGSKNSVMVLALPWSRNVRTVGLSLLLMVGVLTWWNVTNDSFEQDSTTKSDWIYHAQAESPDLLIENY